jgi:hypothetical protein
MSNAEVLDKNHRITSEDAASYKPKGVYVLEMKVLSPPEKVFAEEIAAVTPTNEDLKALAKKHPAPQEWYDEKDD